MLTAMTDSSRSSSKEPTITTVIFDDGVPVFRITASIEYCPGTDCGEYPVPVQKVEDLQNTQETKPEPDQKAMEIAEKFVGLVKRSWDDKDAPFFDDGKKIILELLTAAGFRPKDIIKEPGDDLGNEKLLAGFRLFKIISAEQDGSADEAATDWLYDVFNRVSDFIPAQPVDDKLHEAINYVYEIII